MLMIKLKVHQYPLTLSTLGKIFSRRHFEIFFLFFPETGDNLHEMSYVFWEKQENIIHLSSAENAQRVVKVKLVASR